MVKNTQYSIPTPTHTSLVWAWAVARQGEGKHTQYSWHGGAGYRDGWSAGLGGQKSVEERGKLKTENLSSDVFTEQHYHLYYRCDVGHSWTSVR